MSAQTIAINYSREVGWAGALIAELCAGEPSTAIVTFNYDGRPELGVYRTVLPDPSFLGALSALRRSGYERFPPPGEVPPESKFITVGERRQGEATPTLKPFDVRAVPPEVAAVGQELERVVEEVRRHPLRVLRASATWAKPSFAPDEPLAVTVTLENAGPLPIGIGNPLDPEPPWSGLRLVVWQPGGDEDAVDIHASHLRAPAGVSRDADALLAPGEKLAFELRKKVYLAPGAYEGRLAYQNVIDREGDPQFVRGELWLDLGRVAVERRR
jgi:hypothetical protein